MPDHIGFWGSVGCTDCYPTDCTTCEDMSLDDGSSPFTCLANTWTLPDRFGGGSVGGDEVPRYVALVLRGVHSMLGVALDLGATCDCFDNFDENDTYAAGVYLGCFGGSLPYNIYYWTWDVDHWTQEGPYLSYYEVWTVSDERLGLNIYRAWTPANGGKYIFYAADSAILYEPIFYDEYDSPVALDLDEPIDLTNCWYKQYYQVLDDAGGTGGGGGAGLVSWNPYTLAPNWTPMPMDTGTWEWHLSYWSQPQCGVYEDWTTEGGQIPVDCGENYTWTYANCSEHASVSNWRWRNTVTATFYAIGPKWGGYCRHSPFCANAALIESDPNSMGHCCIQATFDGLAMPAEMKAHFGCGIENYPELDEVKVNYRFEDYTPAWYSPTYVYCDEVTPTSGYQSYYEARPYKCLAPWPTTLEIREEYEPDCDGVCVIPAEGYSLEAGHSYYTFVLSGSDTIYDAAGGTVNRVVQFTGTYGPIDLFDYTHAGRTPRRLSTDELADLMAITPLTFDAGNSQNLDLGMSLDFTGATVTLSLDEDAHLTWDDCWNPLGENPFMDVEKWDLVFKPAGFRSVTLDYNGSLIRVLDGRTLTLDDGEHAPTVFEFDDGGGVEAGHIAVAMSFSAKQMMATLVAAINAAADLDIDATAHDPADETCTLRQTIDNESQQVGTLEMGRDWFSWNVSAGYATATMDVVGSRGQYWYNSIYPVGVWVWTDFRRMNAYMIQLVFDPYDLSGMNFAYCYPGIDDPKPTSFSSVIDDAAETAGFADGSTWTLTPTYAEPSPAGPSAVPSGWPTGDPSWPYNSGLTPPPDYSSRISAPPNVVFVPK